MDYSLTQDLLGSWDTILHTLVVGTLSYFGIIVWLRISGKRTLSKWNSFDFIVTIAMGSVLASAILTTSTPFSQAMVAIGLLVGFQFIITWLSVRTQAIQKLVKAEPTLLLFKGRMLEAVLKDSRVAKGEILAAIRMSGAASTEEVDAVVLETNGNFSVIKELDIKKASAFKDVRGFKENAMREM
ncbi:MAG: YetF domain-containing protein [Cyanobacteria bacterium J06650_10]